MKKIFFSVLTIALIANVSEIYAMKKIIEKKAPAETKKQEPPPTVKPTTPAAKPTTPSAPAAKPSTPATSGPLSNAAAEGELVKVEDAIAAAVGAASGNDKAVIKTRIVKAAQAAA
ncbi:MAG: hypothetical protein AB7F19_02760 [Candidatus Babeliales bacterium]